MSSLIEYKKGLLARMEILTSKTFLFSIGLLLLNDFFLKNAFPGFVTGKLSDFAGLIIFPMFLFVLLPRQKIVFVFTVLFFIWWKSPLSQPFIVFFNSIGVFKIDRVVDYSDFMAFLALPFAFQQTQENKVHGKRQSMAVTAPIFMLTIFALVATAGTYGRIKRYIVPDSKANLFLEISHFLEAHPQYRVPDSLLWLTEEYGGALSEQTADSVSFHFYIADSKIGNIYWCKFSGAGNDWKANRCEFGFIGVKTQDNELLYDSKLDNKRESYLIETLEKNIILPIMAQIEKKKLK